MIRMRQSLAAETPGAGRARDRKPTLLAALAPELLEAPVAAAGVAVKLVAERVLLVVVLVVLLGGIEGSGRHDLGLDGLLEALLHLGLRGLGQALLRLVAVEDRRAVLVPHVAELAVLHQRIDVVPERVEQLLVTDLRRIVGYLDGLDVAGAARGDLLVGGILLAAARISRSGRQDARDLVERRFHAPEATGGEGGLGNGMGGSWFGGLGAVALPVGH